MSVPRLRVPSPLGVVGYELRLRVYGLEHFLGRVRTGGDRHGFGALEWHAAELRRCAERHASSASTSTQGSVNRDT